ncbi:DUF1127 domain-containing protein [Microvirga makkahensis]|uniref:DUF1127 domain-containing protein n=1 Tax=Microvirga makkahensis TaxID=1128670 RepID=A0A7X3MNA1_9HYPH|nr:DUF1127 domain-containing protein [Microvirga makkahensis]
MRNIALTGGGITRSGSRVRAAAENVIKPAHDLAARVWKAIAHERSCRELSRWDERMLLDIGLEPFDVYFGWRGPDRRRSTPSRFPS